MRRWACERSMPAHLHERCELIERECLWSGTSRQSPPELCAVGPADAPHTTTVMSGQETHRYPRIPVRHEVAHDE